jgi:hypothetical protein
MMVRWFARHALANAEGTDPDVVVMVGTAR